jgi:hypothetical protein
VKLTPWQINSSQDSHFGIPFGGYKQSGIGRELGQYALSAYTQVKAVHGKFALAAGKVFVRSLKLTTDRSQFGNLVVGIVRDHKHMNSTFSRFNSHP